ncbi:MAG: nitroreductase family protein [Chloroflexota bacterium]|nr:nitroreductase family protein [Chloroflexota bacterium]
MSDARVAAVLRTRQIREFTEEPVDDADLTSLTEVARWSGSSTNSQPCRFIVIRDVATLRAIAEIGLPMSRSLKTAMAAIAIAMPVEPPRAITHAYDEGRAAERILIGATMLGLGAAITWVLGDARERVNELLHLPDERRVRTIVAVGHPTEAARKPKSTGGKARLPRDEVVFTERWPKE